MRKIDARFPVSLRERIQEDRSPADREESDRPRRRRSEDDEDEERRPRRARGPAGSSSKAVTALILGIVSLLCPPLGLITGLVAIIVGALALRDISRSKGALGGNGMAVTGLILGILSFVVVAPLAIAFGPPQRPTPDETAQQFTERLERISYDLAAQADRARGRSV